MQGMSLRGLVRSGALNPRHIRLAAAYGHGLCEDYLGYEPDVIAEIPMRSGMITTWPCRAYIRIALASARCAFEMVEEVIGLDINIHTGSTYYHPSSHYNVRQVLDNGLYFIETFLSSEDRPWSSEMKEKLLYPMSRHVGYLRDLEESYYGLDNHQILSHITKAVTRAVLSVGTACSFPTHVSSDIEASITHATLAMTQCEAELAGVVEMPYIPSREILKRLHLCTGEAMIPWLLQPFPV